MRRFAIELSKPELWQPARRTSPNALTLLARHVWFSVRRLIAELWAFPVTLARADGSLIAKAYLPGLRKDEVRVEVTDDLLVIEAEPRRDNDPCLTAGRRLIPLREGVEVGLAKAELRNGVLTVLLPVLNPKKHRHVPVESGDASSFGSESFMNPGERILPLR